LVGRFILDSFLFDSKARCISGGARRSAMLSSMALALRRCPPYLVEDAVAIALFRRLHCSQPPPRPLYLGQQHEPAE
jgi:hypothetical protein